MTININALTKALDTLEIVVKDNTYYQLIKYDSDNQWHTIDDLTAEQKQIYDQAVIDYDGKQVRLQRNIKLSETDWTQAEDIPQTTRDLWKPYRQALRDLTNQSGFPYDVVWPEKPQ
jgi:hypothetical protein